MKQTKLTHAVLFQGKARYLGNLLILAGALVLTACGGGADNTQNPDTGSGTSTIDVGNGATQDVTNFKNDLWINIHDSKHCGSCHDVGGLGKLAFANNSNIDDAYAAAVTVVNLNDPASSKMVTKFSNGGHVCWLGTSPDSQKACAQALTAWITKWASDSASTGGATSGTIVKR